MSLLTTLIIIIIIKMVKVALITGITCQDKFYLAELLLAKTCEV